MIEQNPVQKHFVRGVFRHIQETTLAQLRQSTIVSFPFTTKRQHATDTIKITELHWTPFPGVATLFLRGTAQNFESTPHSEYKPIILFRGVRYHNAPANGLVEIAASNGRHYYLEPIHDSNHVSVRCPCKDWFWRFNHYNWQDHSLYGRVRSPYQRVEGSNRPPVNPLEAPGVCKHLLKLRLALMDSGLLVT